MVVAPVARRLWSIETAGFERLPAGGPAILCPNHISFLDSAFLMLSVPRNISFAGKAEYMNSWKTKYVFPMLGMIPIDRSGGSKSRAALDAAAAVLRRGELFGIFPEGTRSRNGTLHKGRTGAARLALDIGCPIFPVGITGTADIQPPDARLPKLFGSCRIDHHEHRPAHWHALADVVAQHGAGHLQLVGDGFSHRLPALVDGMLILTALAGRSHRAGTERRPHDRSVRSLRSTPRGS